MVMHYAIIFYSIIEEILMNKVVITVIGIQKDAMGEENRIEFVTTGTHYFKNGIHYVLYEDSEVSGMEGTSNLLKIADHHVTLVRKGAVSQEQHFELAKKSSSVYRTPYGRLTLTVLTNKLDICYGSISGNIDIVYELSIDGHWQSENQLQISVCADAETYSHMN